MVTCSVAGLLLVVVTVATMADPGLVLATLLGNVLAIPMILISAWIYDKLHRIETRLDAMPRGDE